MCKAIQETSKAWDTPSSGCENLTKLVLPNNNHELTTANHRLVKTHIRKLTAQSYYSALQLTFAADKSNRSCDRIVTASAVCEQRPGYVIHVAQLQRLAIQ